MNTFIVNGVNYCVEEDKKLMSFLRDNLGLKSVKDGCAEGACGTCTVIIDKKAVKACIYSLSKINGKEITTIEGLTEREKEVYTHCFSFSGAVQCGFCIPGMIMAAKALLDVNLEPTRADVKKAIRGNICRCTGYAKIEDAILSCAKYFKDNIKVERNTTSEIKTRALRIDVEDKILGTAVFTDDIELDGMVYAKAIRSKYPKARLLKIDESEALKDPRCLRVIKAEDLANHITGHLTKDWPVYIKTGDITHTIGDAICLVVSSEEKALDEICSLVKIEYEVLEGVFSAREALFNKNLVHEGLSNLFSLQTVYRGNAHKALMDSKHRVQYEFSTGPVEHAFMERECSVAYPTEDGVAIYIASQNIFSERDEIAEILGLEKEKVRCIAALVGGGFGGKEDLVTSHHAAIGAYFVKKPVKVKLTRQESLEIHPKRHAMNIVLDLGCDEKGKLTGLQANILADTGAYASLGMPVLQRACTHAAGPYNFQNISIVGKGAYTNNVVAGAFRGFGVAQSCFAIEMAINKLCEKAGLDPFEFRYKNAIKPGDILPNGQIASSSTALIECLDAVKDAYYENNRTGIACAIKNSGMGVGYPEYGRVKLIVKDGKVNIYTSAACMGQGLLTVMSQIVASTTNLTFNDIIAHMPDTLTTPNSGPSTASRQTLFTGEATRLASLKLKKALENNNLSELEGQEFYDEFYYPTDPITSTKINPVSHIDYSYSAQVVSLDEKGKVDLVTVALDGGTIINPLSAEGQVEGGVVMGLGYGLTENFITENGYVKSKLGTLGLFRAPDAPKIETHFVHAKVKEEAYGAKGIGELCTIPTAPAVAHAYYRFDGKFRTSLPLEETAYRK